MRLPYPGLRAFTRDEADLFFGRERCVDDMVDCLGRSRFLAVLGSSGSGKSSLVRTGLLEALEVGFLASAGSRWLFADMHPGGQPLRNLAHKLLKTIPARNADYEDIEILRSFLKRGPRSIVEWCRVGNLPTGTNLLVVVDQFEELFRYGDYSQREEAEAFVALLLGSAASAECPIYVVITMRSEFLGACALIPNLAEQINKSLYLTPRMTRAEVKEAIEGPSQTLGFAIEDTLVTRLLNDLAAFAPWEAEPSPDQILRLARRADQLPLMQHVLNRLWLRANASNPATITLTLAEYDAVGGLAGALDAHAKEVLARLTHGEHDVEALYRCLIDGYDVASAVRRPCTIQKLAQETGKPEQVVRDIVDAFRAPDCNFLMPPLTQALEDKTIIDVGHESLIRQWSLLAKWLQSESKAGANWQRLRLAATLHAAKAGDLLHGLDLANLDAWWREEKPSAGWAERYGGQFAQASSFLDQSREAEAKLVREQRRRQQRSRWLGVGMAAVIFLTIGAFSYIRQENRLMAAQQAAAEFRERERRAQLLEAKFENAKLLFNEGLSLPRDRLRDAALKFADAYSSLIDIDYRDPDVREKLPLGEYLQTSEEAFRKLIRGDWNTLGYGRLEEFAAREFDLASFFASTDASLQDRMVFAAVARSILNLNASLAQRRFNINTYADLSQRALDLCLSRKGEKSTKWCLFHALYASADELKPAEALPQYERLLTIAFDHALAFHNTMGALPAWELERHLGRLLVARADLLLKRRTEGDTRQALEYLKQAQDSFYSKDAAIRRRDIYEKGVPGIAANGGLANEARRAISRLDYKEIIVPLLLSDGKGVTEERRVVFFYPRYEGEDPVSTVISQLEVYESVIVPEDRKAFLYEIREKALQQGKSFTAVLDATFNEFGDVSTAALVADGLKKRLAEEKYAEAIAFLSYAQSRTPASENDLASAFSLALKGDIERNSQRYLRLFEMIANAGSLSSIGMPLARATRSVDLHLTQRQLARLNYYQGRIKERGYDSAGAAENYLQALILDPTEPKVNSYYALLSPDNTSEAQFGKSLAQRAFTRDENDPLVRFVWGWSQALEAWKTHNLVGLEKALLLMKAGARAAMQEGNKLDEPELRYRLGWLYTRLGQKSEAEKEFESALEASPTGATANQILKEKRDLLAVSDADQAAIQDIAIRIGGAPANASVSTDRARIAIRGYDTVAYFTMGKPRLGFPRFYYIWRGAVWFFENGENRKKFAENPAQFAPAYGGFCAWCLAVEHKHHSTPEYWRIYEGRLFLHESPDYLRRWVKKPSIYINESEQIWPSSIDAAPANDVTEISLTSDLAKAIEDARKRTKSVTDAFERKNYAEATRLQEGILASVRRAETVADGKPGEDTLKALLELSRYQLFAGRYDDVIATADQAVAIRKDFFLIDANRAHALMLKGSTEEAKAVYNKYKGKVIGKQGTWDAVVLENFAALEQANIRHPLMDEIRSSWATKG